MRKFIVLISFLDWSIKGIMVYLLIEYAFTEFALDTLEFSLWICAFLGLLSNLLFLISMRKERKNCNIAFYMFFSCLWLCIALCAVFVNDMSLSIHIFSFSEPSYGNGIVCLMMLGTFTAISLCCFIVIDLLFVFRNVKIAHNLRKSDTHRITK